MDSKHKKSILIVDDSAVAREGLTIYLKAQGYDTHTAESGEKAIGILSRKKFDLVLTNLKMQHIDGIGVLKEVKKLHSLTDVIIMTAYASIETAVGAIKEGAYEYITKPLNMDKLDLVIKRCLEKQELQEEVASLKEIVNLYVMSKAMGSVIDMDKLLSTILQLACDSVNADGSSLMLYNKERNLLEVKVATGSFKDKVIGKTVNIGERFSGRAAELRRNLIQEDVEDQDWFRKILKYEKIESGMSIPMIVRDELIGVLNLKRTSSPEKFQRRDMELANIFAEQIAYAVNNAWVYEKIKDINQNKSDTLRLLARSISKPALKLLKSLPNNNCSDKEQLEQLYSYLRYLTYFSEEINDYASIEDGTSSLSISSQDISKLILGSIEDFQKEKYGKDININYSKPDNTISANIDPQRFKRVIRNLILFFMRESEDSVTINIISKNNNGHISISLEIPSGFKDEAVSIMYKPEYLSKPPDIAILLAKQFISLLGGRIIIKPNENKNPTLMLVIPAN